MRRAGASDVRRPAVPGRRRDRHRRQRLAGRSCPGCRPATASRVRGCTRSSRTPCWGRAQTCASASPSRRSRTRSTASTLVHRRRDAELRPRRRRRRPVLADPRARVPGGAEGRTTPARCAGATTCLGSRGSTRSGSIIGPAGTAGFVPARARPDVHADDREATGGRAAAAAAARGSPPSTASGSRASAARSPSIASFSSTMTRSSTGRSRTCAAAAVAPRQRIVLIGDAAHATSPHCGQGAAQAIEDALVLTRGAAAARRSPPPRSTRSWSAAYERCRFIVEGSEAIGAWEMDHSLPIDPNAKRDRGRRWPPWRRI